MSNLKTRITKLETARGAGKVNKYLCVIDNLLDAWDTPEEKAKGYKVQPYTAKFGGTGGGCFYFKTCEELDAFAARDDVDLTIIMFKNEEDKPRA